MHSMFMLERHSICAPRCRVLFASRKERHPALGRLCGNRARYKRGAGRAWGSRWCRWGAGAGFWKAGLRVAAVSTRLRQSRASWLRCCRSNGKCRAGRWLFQHINPAAAPNRRHNVGSRFGLAPHKARRARRRLRAWFSRNCGRIRWNIQALRTIALSGLAASASNSPASLDWP